MIISAVYKGSQEFVKGYKGSDLLFDNSTIIPTQEYVTDGLTAHFSGYDNYTDGAWVDRVSGYKFTPVSTSTAPVYDETNKLYEATQFGGMQGNFRVAGGSSYSIEFVVRDVKNMSKYSSTNYATLIGNDLNGWNSTGGVSVFKRPTTEELSLMVRNGTTTVTNAIINFSDLIDGALDVFSFVPGVGIFRNGEKISDCSTSGTSSNIGLFTVYTQTNAGSYKAKGKVHAVRYYNRALTAEEVLKNYNTDVSMYGA